MSSVFSCTDSTISLTYFKATCCSSKLCRAKRRQQTHRAAGFVQAAISAYKFVCAVRSFAMGKPWRQLAGAGIEEDFPCKTEVVKKVPFNTVGLLQNSLFGNFRFCKPATGACPVLPDSLPSFWGTSTASRCSNGNFSSAIRPIFTLHPNFGRWSRSAACRYSEFCPLRLWQQPKREKDQNTRKRGISEHFAWIFLP